MSYELKLIVFYVGWVVWVGFDHKTDIEIKDFLAITPFLVQSAVALYLPMNFLPI